MILLFHRGPYGPYLRFPEGTIEIGEATRLALQAALWHLWIRGECKVSFFQGGTAYELDG